MNQAEALELLDWKRRVFDMYGRVREGIDPQSAWIDWRSERDGLFRDHSQSPLPKHRKDGFAGLRYFDYHPSMRALGEVNPAQAETHEIATSGGGAYAFTRVATVAFELESTHTLDLYWLEGYGGGLFLPFRDATAGEDTYGAGRYLLDTVKGADMGMEDGALVIDFNFAYNPSCAYDPRWVCPLAPPANRLDVAIEAGERYRAEDFT